PQLVLLISQSPLVQRDGHIRVVSLEPERYPQGISEFPATRKTTFGSLRKRSHQDVIHFRRKAGPPRRQPRRRHRKLRVQHRHALIPGKWWLAGQQRERRARQRVLISACLDSPTSDLLRRTVIQRPQDVTCSCQAGRRQRTFRQPEI